MCVTFYDTFEYKVTFQSCISKAITDGMHALFVKILN